MVGALSLDLEQLLQPCVSLEWLWQDRIGFVVKSLPSNKFLQPSGLSSSDFLLLNAVLYRQYMTQGSKLGVTVLKFLSLSIILFLSCLWKDDLSVSREVSRISRCIVLWCTSQFILFHDWLTMVSYRYRKCLNSHYLSCH